LYIIVAFSAFSHKHPTYSPFFFSPNINKWTNGCPLVEVPRLSLADAQLGAQVNCGINGEESQLGQLSESH